MGVTILLIERWWFPNRSVFAYLAVDLTSFDVGFDLHGHLLGGVG